MQSCNINIIQVLVAISYIKVFKHVLYNTNTTFEGIFSQIKPIKAHEILIWKSAEMENVSIFVILHLISLLLCVHILCIGWSLSVVGCKVKIIFARNISVHGSFVDNIHTLYKNISCNETACKFSMGLYFLKYVYSEFWSGIISSLQKRSKMTFYPTSSL